ncbi:MAG: pantetheine-phosphate adenylyltransferase [Deltaproteobacteria bacterium]|nr:pantetheine-phosphate adenylyltransferase [Deltaproteobacteria bacterium]
MNDRVALYPGSFDPLTNGHLDIIERGLLVFDRLIVGVAHNSRKQTLFTVDERKEMILRSVNGDARVEVDAFEGLTVDYARKREVTAILRGLRAVADFEYELQMATMNRQLTPGLETLFMMTSENYFFVSSQNVKEIANLGGDVSALVPGFIAEQLREKAPF